ncbi:glycosyltransferase [Candidatus Albibeggiatoa sp. nov. NOAA]|uniref:glycosyltransferase n=1 Tax=Candidatus Albibeggiatoa sp. nov. NOAA TaxID=3162724 RepID=UPI0032F515CF|nr:glycosyltransferase [Thiotrichaceae bacterium]
MQMVLHDYFEALEGGGRLSSILARDLDCAIGYGFAKPEHPFLSELQQQYNLQAYSNIPLWRQFQLARAFTHKTAFLHNYQQVIYSGFYTPLAIAHHQRGQNILYCHTPPRFVYDQKAFYLQQVSAPLRPLLSLFIQYLQPRYEHAVQQMDVIIANSKNIQQRIKHYLNQESVVVHPPCEVQHYRWQSQGDYYLSTARLDPLKRVDKIVQAFKLLPHKKLIVASGGSELQKLKKLAQDAPNIQFTGWLSDSQLQDLIANAIATIYLPHNEDFGMSPVESMAAGKPVIGVAEGGLLETIIPQQTGLLLTPDFSIDELVQAVQQLDQSTALAMRQTCEHTAQQFSTSRFIQQMRAILDSL